MMIAETTRSEHHQWFTGTENIYEQLVLIMERPSVDKGGADRNQDSEM